MFMPTATHFRSSLLAVIAGSLLIPGGCNFSLVHDPAQTITLAITGVAAEKDRDAIRETLAGMTDGSSHWMTTSTWGDSMTVQLSPVADTKAFARKINFGEVSDVEERTIRVEFVE